MDRPTLSVVVPVLNDAIALEHTLPELARGLGPDHQLIVVDGGSTDDSREIAKRYTSTLITTAAGRGHQMNVGAALAQGDKLMFLHADTLLPSGGIKAAVTALDDAQWGRFDVRLSGAHWAFRVIERFISWRSRITGIATGDQAIFVRSDSFAMVGGYATIPLMEDIALSKSLRAFGSPACLKASVLTSSRRWEINGIVRTVLLMWVLRAGYAMGVSPKLLARSYRSSASA